MRACRILTMMAAAAVIVVAGCGGDEPGIGESGNSGILLSDQTQRIPDVPIPLDFELVEERSRHFAAGDTRFIDHLYKGYADKFVTATFYRQRMANVRWKLVSDRFVQGTVILAFRKGPEECAINIEGGGHLFSPTKLMIQVMPAGDQVLAPMDSFRSVGSSGGEALP